MSIQGNINQILGDLSRHITTGAIAANTARQADLMHQQMYGGLTEKEMDKWIDKEIELDKKSREAQNKMEEELEKYKKNNPNATDNDISAYQEHLIEEYAPTQFYDRNEADAQDAIKREQYRQKLLKGDRYTSSEMQRAQMDMYRNLANLKLGDINNRASYAQGRDTYGRETVNGVPKFQHSTDDLSNEDWGVQG